jgi:asparagine synthase (glutamine-hydrolysing)
VCGISGSVRDPDGSIAAAMSLALRHRGPDDDGLHVDRERGVSIAARRLSIIDVEGGHQPLCNEDGDVWAVCNGEIYNFARLRDELTQRGHRFASRSDTEVLVHLYEEYGDEMAHALEGMYAFAVWDERRGRLLIVRDRFGEKPLFYTGGAEDLAFASELGALRAGGVLEPDLRPASVDAFFVFGYVPGPETIFEDAYQLPPGHMLLWEHASRTVEVRRYWSPIVSALETTDPIDELVAETERLLEDSVRTRLTADVPVGIFLSGGVDSSLITAIGAGISDTRLKTFTVGYDVGDVGETAKASSIARSLGTEHHEFELRSTVAADMLPGLFAALDQPVADQALVPLYAVSGFARKQVKVIVGGEGADELFGGYPRYRWVGRAGQLEQLVPVPRALASRAMELPLGRRAQLAARLLAEPDGVERGIDWVTARRRHHRDRFYGERLRGGSDADLIATVTRRMSPAGSGHPVGPLMHFDQVQWLPDDVLVKADRASMLVGLELRTPYLQRELAEFAMSVSPDVHLRNGGKSLLRHLLARRMPRWGRHRRPKTAFRVPSADWLRGPLAPVIRRQIAEGAAYEQGWIDADSTSRLLREHCDGTTDWSEVLWPILTFGLWIDGLCPGS